MRTYQLRKIDGLNYQILDGPLIMGKMEQKEGKWETTCYLRQSTARRSLFSKGAALEHIADTLKATIRERE